MGDATQATLHINPLAAAATVSGSVSTPKSPVAAAPRYQTGPVTPPTPERSKFSSMVHSILPKKSPSARVIDMYGKALQLVINVGLKSIYNNEEFKIGKYTLKQILTVAIVNLWGNKLPANYNLLYISSKSPCTKGQIAHRLDLYRKMKLVEFGGEEPLFNQLPEEKEQAAVAYSIKEFKKGATAKKIYDDLSAIPDFFVKVDKGVNQKTMVISIWELVEPLANLLAFGFIDSNRLWFKEDMTFKTETDVKRFAEACGITIENNEHLEEEATRALSYLTSEGSAHSVDEDVQHFSFNEFVADLSPHASAEAASGSEGGTRKRRRARSRRRNKRTRRSSRK